jgi:hypothetical protein
MGRLTAPNQAPGRILAQDRTTHGKARQLPALVVRARRQC